MIETIDNNHYKEKTNIIIEFFIELYRVLIGSCMIIFVPQNCNGNTCTFTEYINNDNIFYYVTFYLNIFTLMSFLILYIIEMTREYRLLDYLDVNNSISNDNESVGKRIDKLDIDKKTYILFIDSLYYKSGYIAIVFFLINTICSSIVIFQHYLNSNTAIGFLTNVIFMAAKLYNVRCILVTENNIFYSAYLKNFVQYNDLIKSEKDCLKKNMVFVGNLEDNTSNKSFSDDTDDILNYTDNMEGICIFISEENDEKQIEMHEETSEEKQVEYVL